MYFIEFMILHKFIFVTLFLDHFINQVIINQVII